MGGQTCAKIEPCRRAPPRAARLLPALFAPLRLRSATNLALSPSAPRGARAAPPRGEPRAPPPLTSSRPLTARTDPFFLSRSPPACPGVPKESSCHRNSGGAFLK